MTSDYKNSKKHSVLKISLLLLLGALFGCNKELASPSEGIENRSKITFNFAITSSPQTRLSTDAAFKSRFEHGDQVGVFAVSHKNTVSEATKPPLLSSGNYMHNVKLTYNAPENKWESDPPLYYSSDKMDFYIYYPYNEAFTDPNAIFIDVKSDQSTELNYSQSDLITGNSINSDKTTPVYLTLSHKFSLVQLEIDPALIDPNEPITATLLNCKTESTFDMDSNTNPEGTGTTKSINMLRVEKPTDNNYNTSYSFRAIVPSQTVAQGKQLFLIGQNGKFYNSAPLSSSLTLSMATVHRQTTSLPSALYTQPIAKRIFQMGSPMSEASRSGNETEHEATISKNSLISKYPKF